MAATTFMSTIASHAYDSRAPCIYIQLHSPPRPLLGRLQAYKAQEHLQLINVDRHSFTFLRYFQDLKLITSGPAFI